MKKVTDTAASVEIEAENEDEQDKQISESEDDENPEASKEIRVGTRSSDGETAVPNHQ